MVNIGRCLVVVNKGRCFELESVRVCLKKKLFCDELLGQIFSFDFINLGFFMMININ